MRRPALITSAVREKVPSWLTVELALSLAVVATLPLELSKQWFPVSWIELSRIIMVAAVVVGAWRALQGHRRRVHRGLLVASAAVVVVVGLNVFLTQWPTGVREASALAAYALFGLVVARGVRHPPHVRAIAVVIVLAGLVVGLLAISQQPRLLPLAIGGDQRARAA